MTLNFKQFNGMCFLKVDIECTLGEKHMVCLFGFIFQTCTVKKYAKGYTVGIWFVSISSRV